MSRLPLNKQQLQKITEQIDSLIEQSAGQRKAFAIIVIEPENVESLVYSANVDRDTALDAYERLFDTWDIDDQLKAGAEIYETENKLH